MRAILPTLWLLCLSIAICPQTNAARQAKAHNSRIDGAVPAADTYIVKYYVDRAVLDSGYVSGSLHIVYSDKTEVVQKLPPREKGTRNKIVSNEVGISGPKIAEDKRTIAWTEQFENCCTSYSIPLVLAVYRSGKNVVEIRREQMVWNWMFVDGGKRIAAVWGPVHGSDVGDYQLCDTDTGRVIDEVMGDREVETKYGTIHGLGTDAPTWAKELEKLQNGG